MSDALSILVADPPPLSLPNLTNGYAAWKKMIQPDAVQLSRSCWGIIAEDVDLAQIEPIREIFRNAGVPTIGATPAEMQLIPKGIPFQGVEFSDDSMTFHLRLEKRETVKYADLMVIEAAAFDQSTTTTTKEKTGPSAGAMLANMGFMMMTGMPFKIISEKKEVTKTKTTSELMFGLSLIAKNPWRRLDMEGGSFNFKFLGADMTYNQLGNFKQFVLKLVRACPSAIKSKGVQVLMNNTVLSQMGYSGWHDAEREMRWLTALAAKRP